MTGDEQDGLRTAVRRRPAFWRSLRAVAWSFFGVRRSADYAQDVSQLNPLHLVVAGLLAVMILIGTLVALVHWVLASGVAT